jgi:hypothetical protein
MFRELAHEEHASVSGHLSWPVHGDQGASRERGHPHRCQPLISDAVCSPLLRGRLSAVAVG